MSEIPYAEQVEEIFESFDWEKVRKTMVCLEWTWHDSNEPPSINKMMQTARYLLGKVWEEKEGICATGGFRAECYNGLLRLAFEVSDWAVEPQD